MNVLSLFDGISCGRVALERAGIKIDKYYASEIDKYAIQVSEKNYPDIIRLGDICDIESIPDQIDLVIGGSPCQGFSFAGKQLNFADKRSALFFEFVRLLKLVKPKYFLLENVKMKKLYQDVISEHMGVEPIEINSALVSAQNRKRLYWTNIPGVTQPEDRGIVLADVIEAGVVDRDKSYCIDASYAKGGNLKRYFERRSRQLVFKEKSQTILNTIYKENPKSMLKRKKYGLLVQVGMADFKANESTRRVYSVEGKSPTLSTCGGGHREPKIAVDTTHWRKLTPLECERLQTLPDGYTEGVSKTQRYKMLGNAWTVDVIAHIFKGLRNE